MFTCRLFGVGFFLADQSLMSKKKLRRRRSSEVKRIAGVCPCFDPEEALGTPHTITNYGKGSSLKRLPVRLLNCPWDQGR